MRARAPYSEETIGRTLMYATIALFLMFGTMGYAVWHAHQTAEHAARRSTNALTCALLIVEDIATEEREALDSIAEALGSDVELRKRIVEGESFQVCAPYLEHVADQMGDEHMEEGDS